MFIQNNILKIILFTPLIGIMVLVLIPSEKTVQLKTFALKIAFIPFLFTLFLLGFFNKSLCGFQYVTHILWLNLFFRIDLLLGVDGISILFLALSTFLIPLCMLASWNSIYVNIKEFLISFLLLDFFLIGAFCSLDLLFFYIFFESVLIPMFFIIGIWGSRNRKILAAYYLFFYTLLGSIFMLFGIVYVYYIAGTTDYEFLLYATPFSLKEQKILWFVFFLAFASKIPMIPFHLWLPEAHVEAPTSGSVILAGVLLKLGVYGFIRFLIPLFKEASFYYTPLVYTLAVISIIYTSFTAIRQSDFKWIIAYSSIAHMNLVILGIFSYDIIGIEGAILQSISHGFVASGLFLIIGVSYDWYKTRIIGYFGGLSITMPIYVNIFLFFTLANMSFPGTSSFIGEFLILTSSFKTNHVVTFLGSLGIIIGGAYSLWLFNRISFGNLKTQYTQFFFDLDYWECIVFLPLILGTLIIGIYPNVVLTYTNMSVIHLVELLKL